MFAKKLTASAKRTDPASAPDRAGTATIKLPRRARRLRARAQELCWYEALLPSGVMVLGGGKYSATLKLADINYQMATEDRQRVLLERYARFFNSFSAGEQLQVTLINRRVTRDQLLAKVLFPGPRHGDTTTLYRADHNRVVRDKIGSGHFSIVTEKYLTLTVSATSVEHAATALNRVSESVINHMWSLLECQAHRIDGAARVRLLRELTRGCYGDDFDYGRLAASGASTRDELAPASVDLSNPNHLVLHGDESEIFCQSLVMRNYPAWMSDTLFKKLSEVQANLMISFHVAPIDKGESRELVLRRKAMLDMEYTEKRRKLGKAGMDPVHDLPHELKRSMKEVEDLLDDIEQSDQRLFTTTLVVMVQAATAEELKERVDQVKQVAKAESCDLAGLRFFQEQGFNTALPLGESFIPIHRTLTTAAVAVMVPFTSQEILDDGGLFYGTNTSTGNPIIADRRRTRNGNAFILGTSGSGKSHFAKWEMTEVLIGRPGDEVIIIDPEHEYQPLADAFGAAAVEVHAGSRQAINPFDVVLNGVEGDPVRLKAESLLAMLRVLLGGNKGLSAAQESIIDRSITALYARWLQDQSAPVPTLADLHVQIQGQPEPEAQVTATALELYATGSFSGFSQQTNVDQANRFVYYDISKLGDHMKTFGMMVVLDQVWNRVLANYGRGIRTWLYMDEFHLMFTNPHALAAFLAFYKRARKYGLLPTGITQNVQELLSVPEARLMLGNSDVLFLLGQQKNDADELAEMLDLSEEQIRAFTSVEAGYGLLRFGATTLAFNARKPETGIQAGLFNTQFQDK